METYDVIGRSYAHTRQSDPRIARIISDAIGNARSVLNVGAGTGSYEPAGRSVTAVEPSSVMIAQRKPGTTAVVQGVAEHLPFADDSFDAAMAVLTIHHWSDQRLGLMEMRRVSRGPVVVLTWDPGYSGFWLVQDYFPEIVENDLGMFPSLADLRSILGDIDVHKVLIPHDCIDGFLAAYWRRPEAYLDENVRRGISAFALINDISPRLERLRADLKSGAWEKRNADILGLNELDAGYRLIVSKR